MSLKKLIDDVTKESGYETKHNEVLYHCPVCHHRKQKLSVNLDTHDWKCWVCVESHGTKGGSLRTLFKLFNAHKKYFEKLKQYGYTTPKKEHKEESEKPPIRLPEEFKPLYQPQKDVEYRHAIHYLKTRGITLTDIVKYNIGYCTAGYFANHIIFPSYDEYGALNYFTGRTWYDSYAQKYKKPMYSSHDIVGFEFFVNWKYPVFICEGVFDAVTIKRNAIPLFGKTVGTRLTEKLIQHKPMTYLILDNDAKKDLARTCENLIKYEVPLFPVILNEKDPSEMGYKKIHEIINNTEQLSFHDLLKLKLF